ncbi:MAG: MBL fold metallo-hydrolase [Candidatus Lokiarchaeota archaeon]|nr:MBL fold metallo-hydrolase [Candidatus Lokiarchaeota archaeon]
MYFSDFSSEINKIEDVHQIKIDVPWSVKNVSTYLFDWNGSKILFDSGLNMANWSELFFSALNHLNLSVKDIDYCFISHNHTDHVGLAPTLKKKNPELKILMHNITHETLKWETEQENLDEVEKEATRIANRMMQYGFDEKQSEGVIQYLSYWPKLRQYQKPDIILHDGDKILNDLEIIWTPGHSFGHICLFNTKNKFLFCGDHILSRITPHIGNYVIPKFLAEQYKGYDFNNILKHYLDSLDRIDHLNPKIIFPAHQDIIYDPHKRISEIKEHHKNRLAEISRVIKDNPLTPLRISELHFGDLDNANSFLALSEVLGHLFFLENQGLVKSVEKNEKIFYYS